MFVNNDIVKHVEIIHSDSEYIMWVKKVKGILSSLLDHLEHEISNMCSKYNEIYILGDWNAQTSNLADYTDNDEFFSNLFDLDAETDTF